MIMRIDDRHNDQIKTEIFRRQTLQATCTVASFFHSTFTDRMSHVKVFILIAHKFYKAHLCLCTQMVLQ